MKKEEISFKLEKMFINKKIPFKKIFGDCRRIEYTIPSIDNNDQIHIFIIDTDKKMEKNEFGINVTKFQEEDELFVYGFGIDEESQQVITLRIITNLVIETIYYTYKVKYENESGIFEEFFPNLKNTDIITYIRKIEVEKNCKILVITDYFQKSIYQS